MRMRAAVIMDGYTTMQDSRKQARQSFFVEMVDLHFRDQVMRGCRLSPIPLQLSRGTRP